MATLSAFSTFHSICKFQSVAPQTINFNGFKPLTFLGHKKRRPIGMLRSVEENILVPPQQQDTVSVPVSPADTLTMLFQADGTMSESAIPTVILALQEAEGISNLKIQVLEGIATVELTKQTTVQATGVASNLVELIQAAGFKLQTLNLSFDDDEDYILV